MRPGRGITLGVLVMAVAVGTLLRLWPSLHAPGTEFLSDGATIARLALDSAREGRLPAVDSLAEAPAGRALGPGIAPGLIVGAGFFHRIMAAIGSRDPAFDLNLFGALCGGLIAIPVFAWARATWGAGWAGPMAALLVVVLPAHLHRTFGYFMRYEAPGTLLLSAHFAALAAALGADGRRRVILAAAAALLMLATLWTWRVPLIVPMLEGLLFAALLLARGAEPAVREVFAIEMALLTAGMFGIEYLRVQRIPLGAAWLATCAVAAAAWLPRLAPGRSRAIERAAWLALALTAALLLARFTGAPAADATMAELLPAKLSALIGRPAALGPLTRLMLSIEELGTATPPALIFGAMNLGFLGAWLLAAPLVFWLAAGRPRPAAWLAAPARTLLLAGLCVALAALAILIYRAKVLLAPAAAVVVAGVFQKLLEPRWRRPAGRRAEPRPVRHRDAPPERESSFPRRALAAFLIACLAGNAWLSVVIAGTRVARLADDERAALRFLRERTPPDAIIATLWEHGFETQSFSRRRTVLDGFLESGDAGERILTLARAAFARSPDSLAGWCSRYGARYLLVPPSSQLLGVALLAQPGLVPRLRGSAHLSAEEADRTLIRMMVYGTDEPPFRKVFESGLWRVYALGDSTRAAPPGSRPVPAPTSGGT